MWQVFGVPHPDEVYTYRTLREYFAATLDQVASRLTHHKKLVIVLDGVERLSSSAADWTEDSLHSLSWLPDAWPKHVHVVFTTDSAHLLSMRHLANHIRNCVRNQVAALINPRAARSTKHRTIYHKIKGKRSLYSMTERMVPELIPVLGSQPAGDVSHKPGGRLPLLSARPAVTLATLKSAATNFAAW